MKLKISLSGKIITVCMIGIFLVIGCTSLLRFNRTITGSGHVVKETRVLQDFTEVVLSEEGDLFIDIGIQNELIIEAEDNLQDYLIADTSNHVLDLKKLPENVTLNAKKPIRYFLTVKELGSLVVKNSGSVEITEVKTDIFLNSHHRLGQRYYWEAKCFYGKYRIDEFR